MAQMIPNRLDPDTASQAEKYMFALLRDYLDSSYTIFHDKALQVINKQRGGIDDREIDFLIVHPVYGLLAIEVKGGQIGIDGETGQWFQNAQTMKKSPVKQVRQATYDLHKQLKSHPLTCNFTYSEWYGLCFPDIDVAGDLTPDAPRNIILDKRDCTKDNIADSIERIYRHYKKKNRNSPGVQGVTALVQLLAPSHVLRSLMTKDFEDEHQRIKVLTEEQFDVLNDFDSFTRLVISGCAGSGKTLLAMEKARRLAEMGQKVLVVCYTSDLALGLKTIAPKGVSVFYFHELCRELANRMGDPIPSYETLQGIKRSDYFSGIMPNRLQEAAEILVDVRFDAIIVDEGQDFRKTYWTPLGSLLRDPEHGTFYIFFDDNQRVFTQDMLPFGSEVPHRPLRKNLRNVREIGELVGQYHANPDPKHYQAAGPKSDRQPEIFDSSQFENKTQALAAKLTELTKTHGIPPHHIIVLTPFTEEKSQWKHKMTVGDFTLVQGIHRILKAKEIPFQTIYAFKGLERPVVILTELERWPNENIDKLLYIALSRARNYLVILDKLPEPTTRK